MTANRPTPNVVLISIDTLRVDHLSCYGYERETTPNLDRLASDGTRFDRAYGTAVWTPPAHASMLTGLYPTQHGVVDENRLSAQIPTIAEMLQNAGYRTFGAVNNSQVGALTGLDRGHQSFHEVWRGIKSKNVVERGVRFLVRRFQDWRGRNDHGAGRTNGIIKDWLDSSPAREPFYMFLHYIDPHNPLAAPEPYRFRYADRRASIDRVKIAAAADNPLVCLTDALELTPVELEYLVGLYDEEIAYTDFRVGEVVDFLKAAGRYDDTLIMVTADHGEHFGEHGLYSHVASLYEPIVHIPLIVKYPREYSPPPTRADMVQHVDLLPTIAEAAGVEPPHAEQLLGTSLIQRGEDTCRHQFVYAEWEGRVPYFVQRRLKGKPASEFARYREPFWMIRDQRYKYILRDESQDELYDLEQDPGEERNLIADPPADARQLKDRLIEWKSKAEAQAPDQDRYTLDPEVRKHLESLGYM